MDNNNSKFTPHNEKAMNLLLLVGRTKPFLDAFCNHSCLMEPLIKRPYVGFVQPTLKQTTHITQSNPYGKSSPDFTLDRILENLSRLQKELEL